MLFKVRNWLLPCIRFRTFCLFLFSMEELFPLVNENGDLIGKATRTLCHSGSFLLHPVVHLHVFNAAGQLFLQKRSMSKDIQPGMWDTSVGGHVDFEETVSFAKTDSESTTASTIASAASLKISAVSPATGTVYGLSAPAPWLRTALEREACEELGIVYFEPVFVFRYSYRSAFEYELVHTFLTVYDNPLSVDPVEISEGRFWDLSEILANLGKGIFTPNFEGEINKVLEFYLKTTQTLEK